MIIALCFLIGVVAGLRAMTAPAAVSWAAHARLAAARGNAARVPRPCRVAPWIFTLLALGELVTDQLPTTPSRTVPVQFGDAHRHRRALRRGHRRAARACWSPALVAGVVGAVIGTLAARAARGRWPQRSAAIGRRRFLEDAVAIGGAFLIVLALR